MWSELTEPHVKKGLKRASLDDRKIKMECNGPMTVILDTTEWER